MSDDEKKEIAKKFHDIISNVLQVQSERITICSIFSHTHVLARVELDDEAKFIDAFIDRLLMYTKTDEIPVIISEPEVSE